MSPDEKLREIIRKAGMSYDASPSSGVSYVARAFAKWVLEEAAQRLDPFLSTLSVHRTDYANAAAIVRTLAAKLDGSEK